MTGGILLTTVIYPAGIQNMGQHLRHLVQITGDKGYVTKPFNHCDTSLYSPTRLPKAFDTVIKPFNPA